MTPSERHSTRGEHAGCGVLTLLLIVLANVVSTLISISLAALLSFRLLSGVVDKMVSIAAGVLLATALVQLLPEAMGSNLEPDTFGWVLTGGIVGFFILEKLTLIHHTHHHEGDEHRHPHGYDAQEAGRGAWAILVGDAFHNFGDGAVIAAASFVYIALSDLLPEMMRRKPLSDSLPEVALVLFGVALAGLVRAVFKGA